MSLRCGEIEQTCAERPSAAQTASSMSLRCGEIEQTCAERPSAAQTASSMSLRCGEIEQTCAERPSSAQTASSMSLRCGEIEQTCAERPSSAQTASSMSLRCGEIEQKLVLNEGKAAACCRVFTRLADDSASSLLISACFVCLDPLSGITFFSLPYLVYFFLIEKLEYTRYDQTHYLLLLIQA